MKNKKHLRRRINVPYQYSKAMSYNSANNLGKSTKGGKLSEGNDESVEDVEINNLEVNGIILLF